MSCPSKFILAKKKKNLLIYVSDADCWGDHVCAEARSTWEISVLPSQFCCKPKMALRNLFNEKKKKC